jgi:hypothetical protein
MAFDPLPGPPKEKRIPRDYSGIGLPRERPYGQQQQPATDPPPKPKSVSGTVGKPKLTRKELKAMTPAAQMEAATSGRYEIVD